MWVRDISTRRLTVTASTMIARINCGRKVGCHNGLWKSEDQQYLKRQFKVAAGAVRIDPHMNNQYAFGKIPKMF